MCAAYKNLDKFRQDAFEEYARYRGMEVNELKEGDQFLAIHSFAMRNFLNLGRKSL